MKVAFIELITEEIGFARDVLSFFKPKHKESSPLSRQLVQEPSFVREPTVTQEVIREPMVIRESTIVREEVIIREPVLDKSALQRVIDETNRYLTRLLTIIASS